TPTPAWSRRPLASPALARPARALHLPPVFRASLSLPRGPRTPSPLALISHSPARLRVPPSTLRLCGLSLVTHPRMPLTVRVDNSLAQSCASMADAHPLHFSFLLALPMLTSTSVSTAFSACACLSGRHVEKNRTQSRVKTSLNEQKSYSRAVQISSPQPRHFLYRGPRRTKFARSQKFSTEIPRPRSKSRPRSCSSPRPAELPRGRGSREKPDFKRMSPTSLTRSTTILDFIESKAAREKEAAYNEKLDWALALLQSQAARRSTLEGEIANLAERIQFIEDRVLSPESIMQDEFTYMGGLREDTFTSDEKIDLILAHVAAQATRLEEIEAPSLAPHVSHARRLTHAALGYPIPWRAKHRAPCRPRTCTPMPRLVPRGLGFVRLPRMRTSFLLLVGPCLGPISPIPIPTRNRLSVTFPDLPRITSVTNLPRAFRHLTAIPIPARISIRALPIPTRIRHAASFLHFPRTPPAPASPAQLPCASYVSPASEARPSTPPLSTVHPACVASLPPDARTSPPTPVVRFFVAGASSSVVLMRSSSRSVQPHASRADARHSPTSRSPPTFLSQGYGTHFRIIPLLFETFLVLKDLSTTIHPSTPYCAYASSSWPASTPSASIKTSPLTSPIASSTSSS
ncbi:Unknown protein, partial [Striga hermonthica]